MNHKLAIVIPAFKGLYFREALKSIAGQSNKNFNLYIADDCSQEDLKSIADEFAREINIIYKRFDDNLGSSSIVNHWKRSVELSKSEEWIWLFSDDDLMPEDAVERFMSFISTNSKAELVRFNAKIIDRNSKMRDECKPHPEWETAGSFLNRRLKGVTFSFVVEYIFKKDLYLRNKGFIDFPAAWASDDATWALFGKENGIFTIPGKAVLWRQSGINISSDQVKYAKRKIEASIKLLKFIKQENFEIDINIQIGWLFKQFHMLKPAMKLKWYFYKNVFASQNLPADYKLIIFKSVLKNGF